MQPRDVSPFEPEYDAKPTFDYVGVWGRQETENSAAINRLINEELGGNWRQDLKNKSELRPRDVAPAKKPMLSISLDLKVPEGAKGWAWMDHPKMVALRDSASQGDVAFYQLAPILTTMLNCYVESNHISKGQAARDMKMPKQQFRYLLKSGHNLHLETMHRIARYIGFELTAEPKNTLHFVLRPRTPTLEVAGSKEHDGVLQLHASATERPAPTTR